MIFHTPLRYPGGKAKLSGFVKEVFSLNQLCGGDYVEPYAGGAGVALELLFLEYANHIHLNDLDRAVFCFWKAATETPDLLCRLIHDTPVDMRSWHKQRAIYKQCKKAEPLELGFSLFFLNRTNRSGILNGGVIGGLDQSGNYKMDARYNKPELIRRIEKIALYRNRISVHQLDACEFVRKVCPVLPKSSLIYFDPPYFAKGHRLYQNHYLKKDHEIVAQLIQKQASIKWMVSYDNTPEIRALYRQRRRSFYKLDYSASQRTIGTEVMFFSDEIQIPKFSGMRLVTPKGFRS